MPSSRYSASDGSVESIVAWAWRRSEPIHSRSMAGPRSSVRNGGHYERHRARIYFVILTITTPTSSRVGLLKRCAQAASIKSRHTCLNFGYNPKPQCLTLFFISFAGSALSAFKFFFCQSPMQIGGFNAEDAERETSKDEGRGSKALQTNRNLKSKF